ncbi:hypothetical protein ElyMa_001042400 [Elysia marginata]|uniref:Uncharacterized protein n=1 Tax=Elysia marginata TaxID=1093978 RepID=A0AAV4HMK9_9GAST|nr:hypothetical protein ElyMa_001042400 [Elysia marginata]
MGVQETAHGSQGGDNWSRITLTSGGYGGGYGGPMMNYVRCPPGPTSSDSCKDQKLFEALYCPDGRPRYPWVPPRNPWDSSIPDSVKDTAQDILVMKQSWGILKMGTTETTLSSWVKSTPSRAPKDEKFSITSTLNVDFHQYTCLATYLRTFLPTN